MINIANLCLNRTISELHIRGMSNFRFQGKSAPLLAKPFKMAGKVSQKFRLIGNFHASRLISLNY